jgi:hypothetical protein
VKLSGVLWAVVLAVGALVLYGVWRNHADDLAERAWLAERDSLHAQLDVAAIEQTARDAERTRWQLLVDSLSAQVRPLPPVRPTLPPAAPNEGTASDSAAYWHRDALAARAHADTLERDNQALRGEVTRQAAEIQARIHLQALDSATIRAVTSERNRLRALVDSAPIGRKRGINVLGVRLCPVAAIGYGAMVSGGIVRAGPVAAVVQPLSCG